MIFQIGDGEDRMDYAIKDALHSLLLKKNNMFSAK